jgi:sterol desaturase/sphingolipid hydroxylase (fatty acid hydroxylase superfamily)
MIRAILKEIVNSPVLFFGCFFLFRVSLWAPIERLWRARSVSYRQVAPRDFGAQLFHVFLVVPVVVYIYDRIAVYSPFYTQRLHLPILGRIALFLVVSDLGYYWAHRLMHTRPLWRTHQWHHSPKYMYWLAGGRATLPHQFLVLFPYVLLAPITYPSPWWVYTLLTIYIYLVVDWMHLNVTWGGRVLEWVFVTPRFHHIHHSTDPGHYNFNMGNIFTFWDRLFGTYLDPAALKNKPTTFGIDDAPGAVRLIAGV